MLIPILLLTQALNAAPVIQDILDPKAMDQKADPCENFFQYACGRWIHNFKLPADKSHYFRQSNALADHVEENLNSLLKGLAAAKSESVSDRKLGDFYQSCVDVKKADSIGMAELRRRLKGLEEIKDRPSAARTLAALSLIGEHGLFEFYADQDPKDSSRMIAFVDRDGMSLPDPDYYLNDDAKSKETRAHYLVHIANSLKLVGESSDRAKAIAAKILAFETELAKHSLKKDDRRDMAKLFHPMSYKELKALMPAFDWDVFLKAVSVQPPKKLNVVEPEFLKNLNSLLASLPSADLIDFLKYKLIHHSAYYVAGPLQKEEFEFWLEYLRGQKEMPPKWKYCTQSVAGDMSEALGEAYVASIPKSSEIRAKTQAMFAEIKSAFASDLDSLKWMDASTLASAKKKLKKMGSKIGWPAKWRDYSKLAIEPAAFFKNVLAANEFETKRNLAKIGKPTDRSEWYIEVWEPNAYYSPSDNEMVLPLGELVPPVFDPGFSDGANYGSLGGGTIGHELTHGFDDSGKDMDANGNYRTWWTPKATTAFEKQSECYIKQAEAYDIIPGSTLKIRGKATLGENLADNGGVKLGLIVLKKLQSKRPPAPKFHDFDELQQYFLAYAQSWCMKATDAQMRESLLTDFHPPGEFRVNMVLANMPEFADAFQCEPGRRMAPKERCSLW